MNRNTKVLKIGKLKIGGNNPILVQSMCSTATKDINSTIKQIHKCGEAGCEIIRLGVPDIESAKALKEIKDNISMPLVADIHFDYRLALEAAKHADKLRINPGNIGGEEKVKAVVDAAKERALPIRIGVNLASLEKDIEKEYGLTPKAMVESALRHIKILEKLRFYDIAVSLKASDVVKTIEAYRLFSKVSDYPLHLGITEAGSLFSGTVKSAVGIGVLLNQGIGDTIRVSLSADPVEEVRAGWEILKALKLRRRGVEVTSCPTCARADIDVIKIAEEIEKKTFAIKDPVHVAVMGCAVNGPGEAKQADIGVVGGKVNNLLYARGKIVGHIKDDEVVESIMKLLNKK